MHGSEVHKSVQRESAVRACVFGELDAITGMIDETSATEIKH